MVATCGEHNIRYKLVDHYVVHLKLCVNSAEIKLKKKNNVWEERNLRPEVQTAFLRNFLCKGEETAAVADRGTGEVFAYF